MEEIKSTPINVPVTPSNTPHLNVNNKKEPKNINLLISILLICVFILLALVFYIYFTQYQPTKSTVSTLNTSITTTSVTSNVSTNTSVNSSVTSTNSTTKGLEFSTFSNEYITFKYPKGWTVKLNENKLAFSMGGLTNAECNEPNSGFSGVGNIRLISPSKQEIEIGHYFGGIGSGGYTYSYSDPLKIVHTDEIGEEIVETTLVSKPSVYQMSFKDGHLLFSAKTIINGKQSDFISYGYLDKATNTIGMGDFDFTNYSSYNEKEIFDLLKFNGTFTCTTFAESSGLVLVGYETLNDTPANVANILDTFISSIVRKK